MRISVSTRHGQLAQETQEKISQKLEKLGRFHDKISSAEVKIDLKEGKEPSVEVRVAVDRTSDFVSRTSGTNLIGAGDGAVHKMEEQLKKHKKKLIDQHRDAARRAVQSEVPARDESDDDLPEE